MNAILINLMLAMFWLVLGAGLLIHEGMTGVRMFRLPLGGLNPGWLALIFAAFNFYRVWMIRSYQRRLRQREESDEALRRNHERHRAERRRDEPPNPDFIFTDEPAKKDAEPASPPPDDRVQKPNPEVHN
jgi:hypothetical protein